MGGPMHRETERALKALRAELLVETDLGNISDLRHRIAFAESMVRIYASIEIAAPSPNFQHAIQGT